MSSNPSKPINSSDVIGRLRDLTVHLHRGNEPQAASIVTDITRHLSQMLLTQDDPDGSEIQRAQQTMFAIEEVRTLMLDRDYEGAATAARDAVKEWRAHPVRK